MTLRYDIMSGGNSIGYNIHEPEIPTIDENYLRPLLESVYRQGTKGKKCIFKTFTIGEVTDEL